LILEKERNFVVKYNDIEVKICILDTDGVLSDGKYEVSEDAIISKSFYTRDFYAIELLLKNNVDVVIMSQSNDKVINMQIARICSNSDFWLQCMELAKLSIFNGVKNKKIKIDKILDNKNISISNVAYIGDAENDIEVMKLVGITCCPADAIDEVKENSNYISNFKGGNGAVYDFVKYLLGENNENIKS